MNPLPLKLQEIKKVVIDMVCHDLEFRDTGTTGEEAIVEFGKKVKGLLPVTVKFNRCGMEKADKYKVIELDSYKIDVPYLSKILWMRSVVRVDVTVGAKGLIRNCTTF